MAENNKPYKFTDFGTFIKENIKKSSDTLQKHYRGRANVSQKDTPIKNILIYLAKKCSVLLISYLFGSARAVFDTYPFGLALLCSSENNVLLIYSGLLLSIFERRGESTAFFLVYSAALILRTAFSKWMYSQKSVAGEKTTTFLPDKLFCEPFTLRLVTVIVCSMCQSLARLISDGFLYYDLFGLFVSVIACPALFFAFYCISHTERYSKGLVRISVCTLIFSIIYSLRLYYILGFSASLIAAYLITLYVAKSFGVLQGCVLGLFAGLACELSMAPVFALIGFVFGTLSSYSLFAAVSASCLTGLLFGVASDGFAAFSVILPELALASSVFLPLAYYNLLPESELFLPERLTLTRKAEEALINEEKLKDSATRLEMLSSSFDALSQTISALSDKLRRPDVLDIKQLCEESFQSYCKRCSLAGVCYGKDCAQTFDLMGKLTTSLNTKGRVDITDVPGYFADKCHNILRIVSDINISYSNHIEKLIRLDKSSVFAHDYKVISKLIHEASSVNDKEYEPNPELAAKILKALRYMDIDADGIFVYGQRNLHIAVTGMTLSQVKYGAEEIRRVLENVCETRLTLPSFEFDEDRLSMILKSERVFEIALSQASEKMENSEYNGDTSKSFENQNDCFYFLISDGMGSGKEAAMTSRLCSLFISKLLSAGCEKSIVIEMLNGFLRNKSEECSATIDLTELDLLTGKGSFIKSGAAPSYILREKNLYKLQSKTLPIGILRDTDAEIINFELCDGDIIIMFSDGVASSLEDGAWLTSLLCFEFDDDIDKMAKKILERALDCNNKADDMTVALIKINKIKRE